MKVLERIIVFIIMSAALGMMFYLGFILGHTKGIYEQGKWIKVVDTTFHYELKKKL